MTAECSLMDFCDPTLFVGRQVKHTVQCIQKTHFNNPQSFVNRRSLETQHAVDSELLRKQIPDYSNENCFLSLQSINEK